MTIIANMQNRLLKLGYKASAEQFAPAELLRYGVAAEQAGFESVFISDHLQPWRHTGGHAPAALPWMGALAASTDRITIGTSVLTPTFRYHPAVVAQAFGTLGALFPGRIVLGVGTGESLNESAIGAEWPPIKERFARMKEAIQLIRRLWSEERVTHEGDYYRTDKVTIYDRPEGMVPIYIGASGPAATRLAGRIGDGFITTSGKARSLYTESLLPALAEGIEQAGRGPDDVDTMIEVKVSFEHDRETAEQNTRFWGALALSPDDKMGVEDPLEMERLADALPLDRVTSRWIVSTDPDEHVSRILEYAAMGFNHLVFHAPGDDQDRFFALYREEILPRLRSA